MERLLQEIKQITGCVEGRIGVCVRDMQTGEEVGVAPDEPLPMASVCKIPVLVTAYRAHEAGELDLTERVEFTEARRCLGSGLFNAFDPGLRLTLHDMLLMMIVVSDNAATDIVLERLTPDRVTETMRDLGLPAIRVDRLIRDLLNDILTALDPRMAGLKCGDWDALVEQHPDLKQVDRDLEANRRAVNDAASDRDTASARDIARLCAQIARNECASAESCEAMLEILNNQQLNGRLPRDLPAFTRFPHKTGTLGSGAVVNDAGILFRNEEPVAAVAVLSRDVRNPAAETNTLLARIGRAVYDDYESRASIQA